MNKAKAVLAALLLAAMLALPSLQFAAGADGLAVRPAVSLACDPNQGSGCGG